MPNKRLPLSEIKSLAGQLLRTLQALERLKIFHNDLGPPNIALTTGSWKRWTLLDFSHGKNLNSPPTLREPYEKPRQWYRPPETDLGQPGYDPKTDIFSLGCTLFEVAVGKALLPIGQQADIPAVTTDRLDLIEVTIGPFPDSWKEAPWYDDPRTYTSPTDDPLLNSRVGVLTTSYAGSIIAGMIYEALGRSPETVALSDLIHRMVAHENRISPTTALAHEFFQFYAGRELLEHPTGSPISMNPQALNPKAPIPQRTRALKHPSSSARFATPEEHRRMKNGRNRHRYRGRKWRALLEVLRLA
jgi:serine/threonine protein kinase